MRNIKIKGVASTEAMEMHRKRINQFCATNMKVDEFVEESNTIEINFDINYLSFKNLFDIIDGNLTVKIGRIEKLLVEGDNRFSKSTLISADFRRFMLINYFESIKNYGLYEECLIEAFSAYKLRHKLLSENLLKLQQAQKSFAQTNNAKSLLAVKNGIEQVKNELERVYFDLITLAHIREIPIQETKLMLIA